MFSGEVFCLFLCILAGKNGWGPGNVLFLFLKHYFTTYLYIMYGLIDTYHYHFGVSEMGWELWIRIFASLVFLSWLTVHLGFHVLVALIIGISYSEAAAWKGRKKVFFQVTVLRIPGIAVRFYKDGAFHRCFNDGSRLEWFMFAWSGPVERPWTDRVVGWLGGYGPALDELDSWFSSWSPAGFALAAFPVFIWRYRTNCIIPFIWQSVSFNNGRWYGPS